MLRPFPGPHPCPRVPTVPPEASPPIRIGGGTDAGDLPNEVEMPLVDHLEELRQRVLRSLLAVVVGAALCLVAVKPLVRMLEAPVAASISCNSPGRVPVRVFKSGGLCRPDPGPALRAVSGPCLCASGLTRREQRLIAPAVAGSAVLFVAGLAFAWWALVPAALRFLVSYGADVVEPLWSIERYLDFVLLLMLATGLAFQLPVLQLLLGVLGLVRWRAMLGAWRWVVLSAALAGAVLTPSTDPITMLLLAGAITALFLVGVALVALAESLRPETP